MEIIKIKNERSSYNFYLKQEDKELGIIFGGNLDLYWSLTKKNTKLEKIKPTELFEENKKQLKETFLITKENYFIYSLFDDLYNDIKECNLFTIDSYYDYDESKTYKDRNKEYQNTEKYKYLFDGNIIKWHSDEEDYLIADRVAIEKIDDTYVLKFIRPEITDEKFPFRTIGNISIRFRNSGSRYEPFNVIFMRMYNKLQEYNPEYHQIHIEELEYQKKLTLKKSK